MRSQRFHRRLAHNSLGGPDGCFGIDHLTLMSGRREWGVERLLAVFSPRLIFRTPERRGKTLLVFTGFPFAPPHPSPLPGPFFLYNRPGGGRNSPGRGRDD